MLLLKGAWQRWGWEVVASNFPDVLPVRGVAPATLWSRAFLTSGVHPYLSWHRGQKGDESNWVSQDLDRPSVSSCLCGQARSSQPCRDRTFWGWAVDVQGHLARMPWRQLFIPLWLGHQFPRNTCFIDFRSCAHTCVRSSSLICTPAAFDTSYTCCCFNVFVQRPAKKNTFAWGGGGGRVCVCVCVCLFLKFLTKWVACVKQLRLNSNILTHAVWNNHLNKSLCTTFTIFVNKQIY